MPNFFPKLLPASPVGLEPICLPRFTGPLPSFLRFACIVRFPQRPSCPKFRLHGLYCLCSMPASSVGLDPTCPRTCLGPAPFFLPIFCSFSIFCRFRVVFCFKFQALFSSLLQIVSLSVPPFLSSSSLLFLFSHYPKKLSCPYHLYRAFTVFFLLFACIVRFSQRPSRPKFRLQGLYNLCPLPTLPSVRKLTCPPCFTGPLTSFYFSLVSFVFRKDLPVRNSVFQVFTIFVPRQHHHQPENQPVRPSLQSLCCLFTFRSCRSFPAKTFLSEIPSFRSLQSLSHANITVSPKTDLSEYLSRLRTVFPADLLSKLYFLSLSRCFRFLVYKCSFSLISPFSSSLASFFFPRGLALAPLAFSLRLSVWKNFPFHIYINELTLSTLFRDKNDVPKLFLF